MSCWPMNLPWGSLIILKSALSPPRRHSIFPVSRLIFIACEGARRETMTPLSSVSSKELACPRSQSLPPECLMTMYGVSQKALGMWPMTKQVYRYSAYDSMFIKVRHTSHYR